MLPEREMLDRVAQVLCRAAGKEYNWANRAYYEVLARDAITAMRCATGAMVAAALLKSEANSSTVKGDAVAIDRIWVAMIDAALGLKR